MSNPTGNSATAARLVRFAVWGQILGYLSFGLSLAIEDFPDVFSRATVIEFIWPILLLIALHLFRLDRMAERFVPHWLLVMMVLLTSVGTAIANLTGVIYAFGIPDSLESPGWQYLQATATLTFVIFLAALVISVVLSFGVIQSAGGRHVTRPAAGE